jgi:hypothetical protein
MTFFGSAGMDQKGTSGGGTQARAGFALRCADFGKRSRPAHK